LWAGKDPRAFEKGAPGWDNVTFLDETQNSTNPGENPSSVFEDL